MDKIEKLKAAIKKLIDECEDITFLRNLCRLIKSHNSNKP